MGFSIFFGHQVLQLRQRQNLATTTGHDFLFTDLGDKNQYLYLRFRVREFSSLLVSESGSETDKISGLPYFQKFGKTYRKLLSKQIWKLLYEKLLI